MLKSIKFQTVRAVGLLLITILVIGAPVATNSAFAAGGTVTSGSSNGGSSGGG